MEWSLRLAILRLQRGLVYSAIFVLHSIGGRRRSIISARPRPKCKDGLPLSVIKILKTICAPNIKQSGWNMTRSILVLSAINFSPMCLLYSRTQSKCILFLSLWASDKLSSTSTRTSLKLLSATWCIELWTKLIAIMKMLKRILHWQWGWTNRCTCSMPNGYCKGERAGVIIVQANRAKQRWGATFVYRTDL